MLTGLAFAVSGIGVVYLLPMAFGAISLGYTLTAMTVFLLSHVLRAIRLTLITSSVLYVSGRTTSLMHFVTAPFGSILPYKLGEIVRLQQLWRTGRSFSGAIVVLLIDRVFDAVMLLGLLSWVIWTGQWLGGGAGTVMALTTLSIILALIIFSLGPHALSGIQRYIVVNHNHRTSISLLSILDMLRSVLADGGNTIRKHGSILLVLSLVIWAMEVAAASIFIFFGSSEIENAAVFLTYRTTQEWSILTGASVDPAVSASVASGLCALLVVWPFALLYYLPRLHAEPLRKKQNVLIKEVGYER